MGKDPYYFEKLEGNFDKFMSDYDVSRRIVLIDKLWPGEKNRAVLEIGCGTGRISRHLKQFTADLTVNDISEKLARQVAEQLDCKYWAGDCAQAPAGAPKNYDVIVSSECIEHTPDPYASLTGMKALLKKGGRLILTTPNRLWYPVLLASQALKIRKFEGMEHWTWPLKTKSWLKANGFDDIQFSGCHLWPWQIPLAKAILPYGDRWGQVLYPVMINYGFSARKV
jgi:2-polyprenyl-3-methyl-5-hydroxy-6-metoxy-1,4-benzoquinol methylase